MRKKPFKQHTENVHAMMHVLRNRKGFTLTETLTSVLIMSFISLAIGSGVMTVKNVYEKVLLVSEAQTALTTTITLMSDELRFAESVSSEDATSTHFVSGNSGYEAYFKNYESTDSNHSIKLVCRTSSGGAVGDPAAGHTETIDLMTEAGLAKRLGVRFESCKYNAVENAWIIKGLEVVDRFTSSSDPAHGSEGTIVVQQTNDLIIRRIHS